MADTNPSGQVKPEDAASTEVPAASSETTPVVDAAEAARLKREARKARILSKGSDRLARITNTGRGEGASAYLDSTASPARSSTPTSQSEARPTPSRQINSTSEDDPLEVDISTLPRRPPAGEEFTNPFLMGSGPQQQGGSGGAPPQNPMEALMQMMQGGGGPGMGGMGGMGGSDGGQPDMSGLPPQLAAMMQQFGMGGGGGGAGGGSSNVAPTAVKRKPLAERAFDVLQAVMILLLAIFAAKSSLFNADHSDVVPSSLTQTANDIAASTVGKGPVLTGSSSSALHRWARLGYQRPSAAEWDVYSSVPTLFSAHPMLSSLPLFWIFLSLELLLQAVRIVIFSKKTPAPPSLLATLASALPIPNLQLAIRLGSKYLALLNAFVNDFSLLVFVLGATILWSGYQLGGPANLESAIGHLRDEL